MDLKLLYNDSLSHCSYVLLGKNSCVVIDPAREISPYLTISKEEKKPIAGVIETHLHADFISGHMELAERCGAEIYISEAANSGFKHIPLKNEEEFVIDTMKFKMLDTPGHTPECVVFLVADLERGEEFVLMFSGDTLFVNDAGRPDLFPDRKEELAGKLFWSMRRLEILPDRLEVYPTHGAGSLCGKQLSSKRSSTLGNEKLLNKAFRIKDEKAFMEAFLKDMPVAPDYFSRCSDINRKGPALLSSLTPPKALELDEFFVAFEKGASVVDVRDYISFCGAHIPGSYSICLHSQIATFAGWVVPPDKSILLVLDVEEDLEKTLIELRSVGFDNIYGYLKGGINAMAKSGRKIERIINIDATSLKDKVDANEVTLIDVRTPEEWKSGHIEGAINIPNPGIRRRYKEFEVGKPVVFMCGSGHRSMVSASLMSMLSKEVKIYNLLGGVPSWEEAGFKLI